MAKVEAPEAHPAHAPEPTGTPPPAGLPPSVEPRLPAQFTFELGEDIVALGAKKSGKTVFMHWIYSQAPRAIAFNAGGEPGFHLLSDAYVVDDPAALQKALHAKNGDGKPLYPRVEFVASDDLIGNEDRLRATYDSVCGIAYGVGNILLMNDEMALVANGENVTHWMRLLAVRGRHHNVSHVFAGQRNQLMPKTLVSLAAHKVVYAVDAYDAAAYSKWMGFDLTVALKDAPYKSYKWLWITEMQYRVMPPVPLLINEKTGEVRTPVKSPVLVD